MLGLAATKSVFSRLDEWIRRRVRMCYWKQWRYPRTRIRKLLQLGVTRDQAITHGASRKGYWRLEVGNGFAPAFRTRRLVANRKTLGGQAGMTKQWLRSQGLVFLRYLWGDLAPLRRTA